MLEKSSTEGIDVRIRILDFSNSSQNSRNSFEAFSCQVADIIVFDVAIGETFQMHEARIGVSEDGVTVSRDDSTAC